MALTVGLLTLAGGHDLVGDADTDGRWRRRAAGAGTGVQRRGGGADARGRDARADRLRRDIGRAARLSCARRPRVRSSSLRPASRMGGAVSAGDVLLRIDPADAEARLAHRPAPTCATSENELAGGAARPCTRPPEDVRRRPPPGRVACAGACAAGRPARPRRRQHRGGRGGRACRRGRAEQSILSRRQAEAQAAARATDAETALERSRASRWPRPSGNWPETTLDGGLRRRFWRMSMSPPAVLCGPQRTPCAADRRQRARSLLPHLDHAIRAPHRCRWKPAASGRWRVVLDVFGLDLTTDAHACPRRGGRFGRRGAVWPPALRADRRRSRPARRRFRPCRG